MQRRLPAGWKPEGHARRLAGLVGAILVTLCVGRCQGDADFSDVMPTPVTLSAESYQKEITDIDRLVFENKPLQGGRREMLARRLEALAGRIKTSSDSRYIMIESLELRRFASIIRDHPPEAPREPMQHNWMRLRSNLFDDRAWFARSAADLPASGGVP